MAASNNGGAPVVSLRDIKKIYQMGDVEVRALRGVSVDIHAGEMVAIMGPSGSGKSTLMNIIGCLDVPSEGWYEIDGKDVSRLKDDQLAAIRNHKIGFVFQSFNLLPRTTALANVELPLIYGGVGGRQRRQRAEDALRLVGLGDRLDHKPNELSGGQRQRVAFASILTMDADIFVIDEPTSQLDPEGTEDVFQIINTLKNSEKTIILVEHKIDLIAEHCDEILVMNNGQIVASGPTHEVLCNLEITEQGAMIPQTALLGHEMARAGKPLGKIPITISEAIALIEARRNQNGHRD